MLIYPINKTFVVSGEKMVVEKVVFRDETIPGQGRRVGDVILSGYFDRNPSATHPIDMDSDISFSPTGPRWIINGWSSSPELFNHTHFWLSIFSVPTDSPNLYWHFEFLDRVSHSPIQEIELTTPNPALAAPVFDVAAGSSLPQMHEDEEMRLQALTLATPPKWPPVSAMTWYDYLKARFSKPKTETPQFSRHDLQYSFHSKSSEHPWTVKALRITARKGMIDYEDGVSQASGEIGSIPLNFQLWRVNGPYQFTFIVQQHEEFASALLSNIHPLVDGLIQNIDLNWITAHSKVHIIGLYGRGAPLPGDLGTASRAEILVTAKDDTADSLLMVRQDQVASNSWSCQTFPFKSQDKPIALPLYSGSGNQTITFVSERPEKREISFSINGID